jgi:hypothetical protein
MLLPNDVLRHAAHGGKLLRVLWIDDQREVAFTFELGCKTALPQPARVLMLEADVHARRLDLLLLDPSAAPPRPAPRPRHLELQATAWDVIAPLVERPPGIFSPRERARLLAERAEATGVTRSTILRYLRRYWARGQTMAALLPDYANSGAPGKTRAANAAIKRGRPRKPGSDPGLNADLAIRATFRAAVQRYAATHVEFSRRGAYQQMLEDFFREREAEAVPTFGQFKYWIEKDQARAPR